MLFFIKYLLEHNFKYNSIGSGMHLEIKGGFQMRLVINEISFEKIVFECLIYYDGMWYGSTLTTTIDELDAKAREDYNYKFGDSYAYDFMRTDLLPDLVANAMKETFSSIYFTSIK